MGAALALILVSSITPRADAQAATPAAMPASAQTSLVQQYCVGCHDEAQKPGGLSLEKFDGTAHLAANIAAMMAQRLKAGQMPPAGMPRPDAATLEAFIAVLQAAAIPGLSAVPAAPAPVAAPTIVSFPHRGDVMTVASRNAMVHTICIQCHTDRQKPGGISFEHFDMASAPAHAKIAEDMLAKLRAGMMPPSIAPKRPDAASIHAFVVSLETQIDRDAARHPAPGFRLSQRLNRVEYADSIRSMLGLTVDVSQWLPPDTMSHNFDNIAAVQDLSPTLLQSYLEAAGEISRLAVGDLDATATSVSYSVGKFTSQTQHVTGAPMGTRGGLSLTHVFPAAGTYRFTLLLYGTDDGGVGRLFGLTAGDQQIEVAIDDRRVALLDVDPRLAETGPHGLTLETPPIEVEGGPHRLSAAFLSQADGPVDDLIAPQAYMLSDLDIGEAQGITTVPHLRTVTVSGPFHVTGVSDTVSRRKIFICRPVTADQELPCARRIVQHLADEAYRRPATMAEVNDLMRFYVEGRGEAGAQPGGPHSGPANGVERAGSRAQRSEPGNGAEPRLENGDFESGIRLALQAVLVSTKFLFRLEPQPAVARPGEDYRVSDIALASRLSYFLWAMPPDAELVELATAGRLHEPAVL
ncbi:MAG TPA: DUF1587 domain-containing protein, partial [Vicinamibacterales bacterium]|nr:DUF1587 domain-containing protein [Vicinamibacterales bacterium]